ncbi:MAG: SDR family NAD(P)-dependent oxidoreductase [Acidimicrobiales bacterium]
MADGTVLVVGGSSGIGREIARHYALAGREVVLTSRDGARASGVAAELGGAARGLALDLAEPESLADALDGVGVVDRLILAAIERDDNTVRSFDLKGARNLVVLKLVGYAEVVHVLCDRLAPAGSVVLFGGLAKERPYPGSTTVSTVNGGVTGLVQTLACELAPVRVNAVHPGIIGDSPAWATKPASVLDAVRGRTPTGRLASMADVVSGVVFLLENRSVNAVNLAIDGGWLAR